MPPFQIKVPTATTPFQVRAANSSEAASLKGQKAKTPIIAGSVCGGVMGLAWIIGFTIYFVKRAKRKRLNRKIEAGEASPKPKKDPKIPDEKIIIPPDPAILLGHRLPGECAFKDGTYHRTDCPVCSAHTRQKEKEREIPKEDTTQRPTTADDTARHHALH